MTTFDLLDVSVLKAACPERFDAQLQPWLAPIHMACEKFEINTIRRVAAFLATIAHECQFIPGREENLNYSANRLAAVWPNRFKGQSGPNALALACERNPQKLANTVYANRMGNGPAESGDGWRFRGVGPLQLTGRSNHEAFAKAMSLDLDVVEDYLRTLEGGVMSAAWFWEANDINRLADTPGVADEARRINGGLIGLEDRKLRFDHTVARLLAREKELQNGNH